MAFRTTPNPSCKFKSTLKDLKYDKESVSKRFESKFSFYHHEKKNSFPKPDSQPTPTTPQLPSVENW